jgi:hypothetical protein
MTRCEEIGVSGGFPARIILSREQDVVEKVYYLQLAMRRLPATAKGKYHPAVLAPFI